MIAWRGREWTTGSGGAITSTGGNDGIRTAAAAEETEGTAANRWTADGITMK
jgi:hypothetical protein